MTRRLLAVPLLALAALALGAGSAGALAPVSAASVERTTAAVEPAPADVTTTSSTAPGPTTETLPGTTLEAEQRDDGNTSAAPWLIGSGVAAAVVVGLGGLFLKSRTDS
jgi:hypothetical protein